MCGIIAMFHAAATQLDRRAIEAALNTMERRGPDACGLWHDVGVTLGHRRLAVLDLDSRADQPMRSSCGRYAITFNGEIYNFRELRAELKQQGVVFRTTSDTEVLLVLFAREGEGMLPRLRGMFAFVIWDRTRKRGFAARDPYGIKPLYYASQPHGVLFASQVKALVATGQVSHAPDANGQAGFWLLGSVPEPYTWYRDIRALPAGHCVWISDARLQQPHCWWDVGATWREAGATDIPVAEVRERVRAALRRAVAAHLVSDVPVGVFLSGGIDSGALAGLMFEAGATRLQGLTLGFREFAGQAQDETPMAAHIAAHYSIHHHVRIVTREEFRADLPRILRAMDQPSIDGINTWYASKAAAELGLKVVVSGAGGDELFQGYSSFRTLPRLVGVWRVLARLPGAMTLARAAAALQVWRTGNNRWRNLPEWSCTIGGAWWLKRSLFSFADLEALMDPALAAEALANLDVQAWLAHMTGSLPTDSRLALGQIESMTYLRNQLLRDSDWASMDHSVELRTPLIDAWLLRDLQPLLSAFGRFPNKSLLAQAPTLPLPGEVARRRKTGFGVPLSRWIDASGALAGGTSSRAWSRRLAASYQQVA